MIDGIGSTQINRPPPPPNGQMAGNKTLTDEQKSLIEETLAQYDSNDLSQADAQAIVSAFQEAGIGPGRALASAMDEAGFDAKDVGKTAGLSPPPPKAGSPNASQQGVNVSEDVMASLYSMLDQYYSENISSSDKDAIKQSITELLGTQQSFISTTV